MCRLQTLQFEAESPNEKLKTSVSALLTFELVTIKQLSYCEILFDYSKGLFSRHSWEVGFKIGTLSAVNYRALRSIICLGRTFNWGTMVVCFIIVTAHKCYFIGKWCSLNYFSTWFNACQIQNTWNTVSHTESLNCEYSALSCGAL
jgi:hypothetical protein